MSILQDIVTNKRSEVEENKAVLSLSELKEKVTVSDRDFFRCLKGKHNIIAEIKFKSPSMEEVSRRPIKDIVQDYDTYANAISVLTDEKYFGGDLSYLKEVRMYTKLPLLRKDFIIDSYQIYEARYYGADAVLLITSILTDEELTDFLSLTHELGMHALVEVHTKEQLDRALSCGAKIIGVNNRNLSSDGLEVDISTTPKLKKDIPSDVLVVSESGIFSRKEILSLDTNAVLIGTSLMKSVDPLGLLSSFHRTKVKICGITSLEDAKLALASGADLLGFNFYVPSPRYISPSDAKKIISQLPLRVQSVGVFVDSSREEINATAKETAIDFIQLHGESSPEGNYLRSVIHVRKVDSTGIHTPYTLSYATLYDTRAKLKGGTGISYERKLVSSEPGKIFIAGGITPSNVTDALSLHPYAVDSASGVESQPGKKDPLLMKDLILKVNTHEN